MGTERDTKGCSRVEEILSPFRLSKDTLGKIRDMILGDLKVGLTKGTPHSSIPMLPSFLPALPDGSETGRHLAIDLSGTNLRIMCLTLAGRDHPSQTLNHNFLITNELMNGTDEQLFNFMASCLSKFLRENDLLTESFSLGFVFSYPCEQISIRCSKLLWWTKGFKVEHVIGKDVVKLLEDGFARQGELKINVRAIMNDTVAQLASAAAEHGSDCIIGVVVSNGCNASYLEEVKNIAKFNASSSNYSFDKMVIDCEWEDFGNKGELDFIRTQFDKEIDEHSVHKGKQIVDKLTGGLYLGEIARRIFEQLVVDGLLFSGEGSERLSTVEAFPTKYLAEILTDEGRHYKNTRRVLDELQILRHTTNDYAIMQEVCRVLSNRSAGIVAAALAALMQLTGRTKLTVGIGGKLYEYLPMYSELVEENLQAVAHPNIAYNLVLVHDGSVRGAALVSAVAEKMNLR